MCAAVKKWRNRLACLFGLFALIACSGGNGGGDRGASAPTGERQSSSDRQAPEEIPAPDFVSRDFFGAPPEERPPSPGL
jgi:hypothetical protein